MSSVAGLTDVVVGTIKATTVDDVAEKASYGRTVGVAGNVIAERKGIDSDAGKPSRQSFGVGSVVLFAEGLDPRNHRRSISS